MLNSYLVNAAVANGTGTSQKTVSAIAFAGSASLYSSLCRAFRVGTVSSGSSTGLVRNVVPTAFLKQAGSSVAVQRYVSRFFLATANSSLNVVRGVAYSVLAFANSFVDVIKFVRMFFTYEVFASAGRNILEYNPMNGFVMNGFAINDGVPNYKEERVIIGVIVKAIAGASATVVRYVSRLFSTTASNAERVVKQAIPTAFSVTLGATTSLVRFISLTESVAVSEAVSYIKFLRVVIATLVVGTSVKVIKMVKLPKSAIAGSSEYVVKMAKLIRQVVNVAFARPIVKDVSKIYKTVVSNTAAAFKLRVVERLVQTVVKVSYIRFLWNYSFVATTVKASRIRLAFLVGVRKLSQFIMSVFGYNVTTVVANTFTIYVVNSYSKIVVPPEDTEIV